MDGVRMITATARILKNLVEIQVGEAIWVGRPVEAEGGTLSGRIAALFSTEYHLHRPAPGSEVDATVSYRAKTDEIRIQVGDESWKTRSSTFGPMTISYGSVDFTIHERLTGRFAILNGTAPVASGQLGFRSCVIRDYPGELEGFLVPLSLGYVIRTLTWEMVG
jgi:hypothetical protein